ncbi:MoaD/ThiS family protein [Novosphingobium sp. BL-8H]|uniref:MoaD/ThiS family protein n=1 Tax=Novosphingobium sp. BL-8H TaxID=3127640 RepID=UPI003758157F
MQAKLVFLGRLEDMAGRAGEDISILAPLDWYDVIGWLGDHYPPNLADAVAGSKVKVAINGALIADKHTLVLADGDELAFLPPVSGG